MKTKSSELLRSKAWRSSSTMNRPDSFDIASTASIELCKSLVNELL